MVEFERTSLVHKGCEVTTWEGGSGPTVLFLHDGGGAAALFAGGPAPFLLELAKSCRILVPEHPGFGPRDRPDWLDNIHDLAYHYLDYLKLRGLEQVHLVGQSLGGWVALELAVRSTARLASVTLAGASGIRVSGVPPGDLFLWSPAETAANMLRDPERARLFLAALQRDMSIEEQREALRNRETLALLAWEPRLFDPDLYKWLHRIDVPTHVVWADTDRLLPAQYGEAIAGMIAGSRLSVIPDSGHLVHLDQPQAFSRAVGRFIEEVAA